ncbi:PIN domain-containing protein [Micromonospora echinofusca]|uniref:PIN domain-containing protein n=1 Tax=Micromonospora echinofusca TaxID=47858 RepID=A0A1C5G6Q0_MICEH|nr:PIN domain-containing protein [Micromonospora echinofusca]SCG15603.1 PIN domain-containing protein [Micromonospora echinofusca]
MDTARLMRNRISSRDIDRLVFTPRFWRLQDLADHANQFARDLLSMEITDRSETLDQAHAALTSEVHRWSQDHAEIAVVDTTVFIRHSAKIREIEYAHELGLGFEPVRLVVPRVVVDELDRLKESSNQHVRWRAGHTLGVLDELLRAPQSRVTIREADKSFSAVSEAGGMPRDKVTIEVLFDDPHHVRLEDNDDEIIDRAFALQAYAGRGVRLLTMDTSMALRARMIDLQVIKIEKDIGPEPAATEPKPRRSQP